jgi:hypothetical protein
MQLFQDLKDLKIGKRHMDGSWESTQAYVDGCLTLVSIARDWM